MYKDEMNYANNGKIERQEKGQFFTPELVLDKMFKYVKTTGTLLDNSMGSGNILAYAIQKRGFEPSKCYGIEFDPDIYDIAVERLTKIGVPKENLVLGDALSKDSYRFGHLVNEKHFDLAVINPPYKIGNQVAIEALNRSDSVICLMPLWRFKPRGLWKSITHFEVPFTREETEDSLFESAIISFNLSIGTLSRVCEPKYKKVTDLDLESYDQNYYEFYKWNIEHKPYWLDSKNSNNITDNKIWFTLSGRVCVDRIEQSGLYYDWNNKLGTKLGATANTYAAKCPSEKFKDNLVKWFYYKGKQGLACKVITGLWKSSGNCFHAIPVIDFEKIEENSYWKQGLYDEAVLDTMNLKMENGKIVKK